MHYPVGILPAITTVQPDEQHYEDAFNDVYSKKFDRDLKTNSAGMPVSISVVAHPWEDEVALGVMKALSEVLPTATLPFIKA